ARRRDVHRDRGRRRRHRRRRARSEAAGRLPGRHLRERGWSCGDRPREHRRVHPVRAVHPRLPSGDGAGAQAVLGRGSRLDCM
ncbi:MAG: hypothetical protein AVDCRST_MAG85-2709, partial [uncultured Solirubrobacteraceae bacterium]